MHEIDPYLRKRAEALFRNKDNNSGIKYLTGPVKRELDLSVAGPLAVLSTPAIGLLGLCVFAQDGHFPYVNAPCQRPNGEITSIFKVRTMIPNARLYELQLTSNQSLAELKNSGNDPRVTKFGDWCRRRSLDELPQFYNVLSGQLSMVSPRPLGLSDWEYYVYPNRDSEPFKTYLKYMEAGIKYGLTGLYGILGRSTLGMYERIVLDNLYCERASLTSDMRIILQTIPALISMEGAR